jgi:hypothetical protein
MTRDGTTACLVVPKEIQLVTQVTTPNAYHPTTRPFKAKEGHCEHEKQVTCHYYYSGRRVSPLLTASGRYSTHSAERLSSLQPGYLTLLLSLWTHRTLKLLGH